MSTQPEALRLAEILEEASFPEAYTDSAATELRRLHETNQELLEALKDVVRTTPRGNEASAIARAAIAKATGEQA